MLRTSATAMKEALADRGGPSVGAVQVATVTDGDGDVDMSGQGSAASGAGGVDELTQQRRKQLATQAAVAGAAADGSATLDTLMALSRVGATT